MVVKAMYLPARGRNIPEHLFVEFMETFRNNPAVTVHFIPRKGLYKDQSDYLALKNYLDNKQQLHARQLYRDFPHKDRLSYDIFKSLFNRFIIKERVAIAEFGKGRLAFPKYINDHNKERYDCEHYTSKYMRYDVQDTTIANNFEIACEELLKLEKIDFYTEDQIRQYYKDINRTSGLCTPDIVIKKSNTLLINGSEIKWIDAKAFYGSYMYANIYPKIRATVNKYYERYQQKGAIIFLHGFHSKLYNYVDPKKVILIDASKSVYLKKLYNRAKHLRC
jgi:hypothetical protein